MILKDVILSELSGGSFCQQHGYCCRSSAFFIRLRAVFLVPSHGDFLSPAKSGRVEFFLSSPYPARCLPHEPRAQGSLFPLRV